MISNQMMLGWPQGKDYHIVRDALAMYRMEMMGGTLGLQRREGATYGVACS